jgi:peptide/nickel transport system substrate-binding protein
MTTQKSIFLIVAAVLIAVFSLSACAPVTVETPGPAPTAVPTVQAVLRDLTVLQRQSPTSLNPHLSRSVKDLEPSRIVYEPLATFNVDGILIPILAAEIPSLENGGLAADGKSVIWKLRRDVRWSDGVPFTANDVVFTYSYITDPEVKAGTKSDYGQITNVEVVDNSTVKVTFKDVNPAWAVPFVGNGGVILPRHIFEAYKGANAREAPANTMPVGTGPYLVKEPGIKPQEVLFLGSQIVKTTKIVFEANPYYRFPDKITFHRIIWRGGGTADDAANRSLQVGDVDLAYDLDLVDLAKLSNLLANSDNKGKLVSVYGAAVERVLLNRTNPNKPSADGEYSSLEVPHPLFSDKKIRQAIAHAINRDAIAQLYGDLGLPTSVNLVAPPQYRSSSVFYEYDPEKAKALLDEAGCTDSNGDGFREKDGVKMKVVLQNTVGAIQQQIYKIIQKDFTAIGIDTELKMVDSSIMFGSGATNPDADTRFNADMMIFRFRSLSPDPSAYMESWTCKSIPQKSNDWGGGNDERWCNPEYDALIEKAKIELDPAKRQEMFIQLNDMLIEDVVMLPTVWRATALGVNKELAGLTPTPWDSITWNVYEWHFTSP